LACYLWHCILAFCCILSRRVWGIMIWSFVYSYILFWEMVLIYWRTGSSFLGLRPFYWLTGVGFKVICKFFDILVPNYGDLFFFKFFNFLGHYFYSFILLKFYNFF
jgi:hypothetical protein